MMNLAAICLVVTALIGAEAWSPGANPVITTSPSENDVVVKDGHRVVVVEYDQDGKPNTKVTISPTVEHEKEDGGGFIGKAKEKIKETVSDVLPNVGQGISQPEVGGEGEAEEKHRATAGELICDALGRCKHRIAGAIGKTKDKGRQVADRSEEAVHAARDSATHLADEAQQMAAQKTSSVEEMVAHKAQDVKEGVAQRAQDVKDSVAHKAHDVKEGAAGKAQEAKEGVAQKARDVKDEAAQKAHEVMEGAAQKAHDMKEGAAQKAHDVKEGAARKAQEAKEGAFRAEQAVLHSAHNVTYGLKGAFNKILTATEISALKIARVLSPSTLGRVIGMLGFSTAYGMCMWVTFVSSYVMGELLPRQQLGVVQSKIYPVYFRAMAWTIGLALLGHLLGQGRRLFSLPAADIAQGVNLMAALLMVVANAVFFEPRATKAMFERMKIEKEEGRGKPMFAADSGAGAGTPTQPQGKTGMDNVDHTQPQGKAGMDNVDHKAAVRARMAKLSEQLKKLNSYSSWLNIMTLMSLTWYLVYIAQRLC